MIVWDTGTWDNITSADDGCAESRAVDDALDDGHLSIRLHGEKLTGGYTQQRFRDADPWLLIKRPTTQPTHAGVPRQRNASRC